MKTIARTWPYGTRKTGTVVAIVNLNTLSVLVVRDGDDPKKAHVLMYGYGHFDGLNEGDTVTIEFKEGGPTGGYWDVVKDA